MKRHSFTHHVHGIGAFGINPCGHEKPIAKTILLVDDSATTRMKSRMIFGNIKEYEFLSACDGKEAVEVAIQRKPDLILMDVEMPRMTGIEACRVLRNHAGTRNTPNRHANHARGSEAVKRGLDSGCNEYLLKTSKRSRSCSGIEKISRIVHPESKAPRGARMSSMQLQSFSCC